MRARISKISLIVFVILLVLSGFLLAAAGYNWPWFAVMAIFAVVPIVVGPRKHRLFGIAALLLSVLVILIDYEAGNRLHARLHRVLMEKSPATEGLTNRPSKQPPPLP